jgi:hypothetical protein
MEPMPDVYRQSIRLLVKTVATVKQQGMDMTWKHSPRITPRLSGYCTNETTSASGMEIVTTFTKVEVNVPIEDTLFKLK